MLGFSEWTVDSLVWEPTSDITVKGVSCPENCQEKITLRLAKCTCPPCTLPEGRDSVRASRTCYRRALFRKHVLFPECHRVRGTQLAYPESGLRASYSFSLFLIIEMNLMFCSNEQQEGEAE